MIMSVFSLLAELERDLSSMRTLEALAAKKGQGSILGKPGQILSGENGG
jgi:DNA invertase Pin-like site-specific DNA recombinase